MPMPKISHIETPDGRKWYFSYHAKQRMNLYGLSMKEAEEVLLYGGAEYAYTASNVFKVFNKRIEMVINNKLGRIITIYKRS